MPTSVTLSPRMRRQAERIACGRVIDDRTVYGQAAADTSKDSLSRHLLGALGEFAFAVYYDLEVDSSNQWTDPGYDFFVTSASDSVTVDVKTTRYRDGDLLVPTDQVTADWYVLVYAPDTEAAEVELLGRVPSSAVLNSPVEPSIVGKFANHTVQQAELRPLPDQSSLQSYDPSDRR